MDKVGSPGSLCFKENEFVEKNFSVDQFVSSCKDKVNMTGLREDLEIHYKHIQLALIELINCDYADFLSLSSNLIGTEKSIETLHLPLIQLKDEVLSVKEYLSRELETINAKLEKRKKIRENKSRLHHLINVVHSVEKIEKILIADPSSPDMEMFLHEEKSSGHFLERIAGEFNQLQFHVKQSKGHPITHSIIPRVALITSKLQANLESTFQQGISSKLPEVVLRCLRTYALIDKIADAEILFRNSVVEPFTKDVINESYHTENGIEKICEEIIRFMDEECKMVFDLTSDVSKTQDLLIDNNEQSVKGFDFLVNSIWVEVATSFEERLPLLFSPGNPNVFLQRYKIIDKFVNQIEDRCVSTENFNNMRKHPSYESFMIKWSLPVYFQVRFQEIGGKIEAAAENPFAKSPSEYFLTNVIGQSWNGIAACWDESVYLSPLKGRLWKLTLQIMSRVSTFMKSFVADEVIATPSATIEQLTLVLGDGNYFKKKTIDFFNDVVSQKLKESGPIDIDNYRDSLHDSTESLSDGIDLIKDVIVNKQVTDGFAHLESVKNVPRLYRRTNKEYPTLPSSYIQSAFTSINHFRDISDTLDIQVTSDMVKLSILSMTSKYYAAVEELLTSIKKTEESLLRLKQQRKAAAGQANVSGGNKESEVSDESKIRKQLCLDADEYGVQIKSLGFIPEEFEEFTRLKTITEKAMNYTGLAE